MADFDALIDEVINATDQLIHGKADGSLSKARSALREAIAALEAELKEMNAMLSGCGFSVQVDDRGRKYLAERTNLVRCDHYPEPEIYDLSKRGQG